MKKLTAKIKINNGTASTNLFRAILFPEYITYIDSIHFVDGIAQIECHFTDDSTPYKLSKDLTIGGEVIEFHFSTDNVVEENVAPKVVVNTSTNATVPTPHPLHESASSLEDETLINALVDNVAKYGKINALFPISQQILDEVSKRVSSTK